MFNKMWILLILFLFIIIIISFPLYFYKKGKTTTSPPPTVLQSLSVVENRQVYIKSKQKPLYLEWRSDRFVYVVSSPLPKTSFFIKGDMAKDFYVKENEKTELYFAFRSFQFGKDTKYIPKMTPEVVPWKINSNGNWYQVINGVNIFLCLQKISSNIYVAVGLTSLPSSSDDFLDSFESVKL